ncbi:antibiotic biosynthesis monooxygenase [Parvibaculum lavamentivorans]|nr:antibiotic biosynthesis monooxygenase [Rhodobiaceae bacterium]MBN4051773.1 antibiotic biosynthesis monooxygenase [Parvibaculum lavamentivorans]
MTIAHLITYKTSSPDTIISQSIGYKERELDRSPPDGFLALRVYADEENGTVLFLSEWESAAQLAETQDSAPWEAAMDLNETFSDDVTSRTFKIIT